MKKKFLIFSIFFFVLSSCHVGPKYESISMKTAAKWKNENKKTEGVAKLFEHWWDIFEDEDLQKLEQKAIHQNLDLFIALQRVLEARAAAGVSKSALYPHIDFDPSLTNMFQLFKLYGIPPGVAPGLKTTVRVHEQEYQLPLMFNYEFDFWGKYRGQYNSATLHAEAQEKAALVALLSVTTELASLYFNLRTLDTQLDLLEKTINILKDILYFHNSRFGIGVANYLDVSNTEAELKTREAEYEDTLRQRSLFENGIALLIGESASEFHLNRLALDEKAPPSIPAGLPSSLLLRRPDILEAEKNMASEHALIGVAYSSFFPSFNLTNTGIGLASPELKDLFHWESRLLEFGLNIIQHIFDAGKTKKEVEVAKARYQQSLGFYKKTVLTAFKETEDALSSVEKRLLQEQKSKQSLDATTLTLTLSKDRYQQGLVNQLEVLLNQKTELSSKRTLASAHGFHYQATIELIKALGGSWE